MTDPRDSITQAHPVIPTEGRNPSSPPPTPAPAPTRHSEPSEESVLPPHLPLTSQSPLDDRLATLRATFPEVFREDKIDFDALRCSLGDWVDPGKERFGLTWPGKADLMRLIQQPSVGTLRPMPDESVDWDTTQNMIIEGDNLEVLKLLQKSYHGKVKLIYIDPPTTPATTSSTPILTTSMTVSVTIFVTRARLTATVKSFQPIRRVQVAIIRTG